MVPAKDSLTTYQTLMYKNHYPDPGVTYGHFRVLPCTTGGYVIVDDRRRPGMQRVGKTMSLDDASYYAASKDTEDYIVAK